MAIIVFGPLLVTLPLAAVESIIYPLPDQFAAKEEAAPAATAPAPASASASAAADAVARAMKSCRVAEEPTESYFVLHARLSICRWA